MEQRNTRGRSPWRWAALACLGLLAVEAAPAVAKPPSHAPAHGYRRKQQSKSRYYRTSYRDRDSYRRTSRYTGRTRYSRANDFDRDGIPNWRDQDIDGDGVPNRRDDHDYNPRRR
jgi:hypothetical protein